MLRHAPFCKSKSITSRLAVSVTTPTPDPPTEPTPVTLQSESQKIVDAPANPIAGPQATLELEQWGFDNGQPSWWLNGLATNYQFWGKFGQSTDPNVELAWQAYQAWLQDKINNDPFINNSRIDYGQWWLSQGQSGGFNNYKWN